MISQKEAYNDDRTIPMIRIAAGANTLLIRIKARSFFIIILRQKKRRLLTLKVPSTTFINKAYIVCDWRKMYTKNWIFLNAYMHNVSSVLIFDEPCYATCKLGWFWLYTNGVKGVNNKCFSFQINGKQIPAVRCSVFFFSLISIGFFGLIIYRQIRFGWKKYVFINFW